jgi:hypothetical protein
LVAPFGADDKFDVGGKKIGDGFPFGGMEYAISHKNDLLVVQLCGEHRPSEALLLLSNVLLCLKSVVEVLHLGL